ncbi:M14 family zinc carboxypeptidase [Paraconexibacter algicola]|uniref:Peptidase M14 domain-containing protein n=1 Tax=Paraconexibacter algicola TaxID=2133960 RepID=A0A2T4UH51_9ACTN|nr:M14 family zinc carboxypeptidase [Paraconexibacter algicola]PTL58548.1 hypothetical protein C7Y72_02185 [Paraconexibacter algicola]
MLRRRLLAAALSAAAIIGAGMPAAANAQADPAQCTPDLQYDSNIPSWDQYYGDGHNPAAKLPFGTGGTGRVEGKNQSAVVLEYFDAVMAAVNTGAGTASGQPSPTVRMKKYPLGRSVLNRELAFYVLSTPDNVANLDEGRQDGPFWAGVRAGTISEAEGLAAVRNRPALAWVTATPHGNEPAAAEAIVRQLYELVTRKDCANQRRLKNLDLFLMPVRNPDGRDNDQRTSAWAFDHNRDFGTRQQSENRSFIPQMNKYPGLFFIDAHQQSSGYFFPPNEDPVHHELSDFTLDTIQNTIGPALQQKFNDQSGQYQNYNSYDMFTPEYGDSVPSLIMGAAGMTYEKGVSEAYGKQAYDHYLAIDETINVVSDQKVRLLTKWVEQWQEAIDQGAACNLQPNKLVSPLHDVITQQPSHPVCGYFFRADEHSGDVAKLIKELLEVGVHVYKLDSAVNATGVREFGKPATTKTLPAGTFWIPMAQSQKHWIQAVLGEDPFIAFPYFYDVVTWSYPLQRGLAGSGFLVENLPVGVTTTEITAPALGTTPAPDAAVYAFDTDSMAGLGLVVDLLDRGATVYRSGSAFTAAGRSFATGAALVDGATVRTAGIDLAALSAARETPIAGLASYPVARYLIAKPKIGLFTGGTTVPSNPLQPGTGTGQCTSTSFCEALFTLTQKDKLPASAIVPITTTQLAAGELVTGQYTAFINPGSTIAAGTGASALQAFVNGGGRYVGSNAGGVTSARNAGITQLNTVNLSPTITTPGTEYSAEYTTASPVGWGFDRGGFIYRDASSNPVFDPATVGTGTVVAAYGTRAFGYQVNSLGAGKLDGRPAVVEQRLGSGRATLLGFNPFFRAWKDQDERLVLNAVLAPSGDPIAPAAVRTPDPAKGQTSATAESAPPAAESLAKAELPKVASRPVVASTTTQKDVRITVRRSELGKLRTAVKRAKLSKALRSKVRWATTKKQATFIAKNARLSDDHDRNYWTSRVMGQLKSLKVKPLQAQL